MAYVAGAFSIHGVVVVQVSEAPALCFWEKGGRSFLPHLIP
jgi:hypothetical protein